MRHIADGTIRRLADEPMAVPDRVVAHLSRCPRCAGRRAGVAEVAGQVRGLLAGPRPLADVDRAWTRLQAALGGAATGPAATPTAAGGRFSRRRPRRALVVAVAASLLTAGTAAAATMTTIFAPTRVAPLSLSRSDLQTVASVMGLGDRNGLGGFPTPSGQRRLAFGVLSWSSSGPPGEFADVARAAAAAGFPVPLPGRVPAGVGRLAQLLVEPQVRATVSFSSAAGDLAGSRVDLVAGPAVLAVYGSRGGGAALPTLAVLTMPRPTAQASGASLPRIESFLLSRPGLPGQLAEEVRLLGDLSTTLPVPVPAGASVRQVQVAGSAGVLVTDSSRLVAGVVWEDPAGKLHLLAGLVSPTELLHVAGRLR